MYAVVDQGPVLRFAFRLLKKRILHETACSRRCQPGSRPEEPDNPRFGLTLLNQLSYHLQLLHPPMNALLPLRIQQSVNIVLAQRQPLIPTQHPTTLPQTYPNPTIYKPRNHNHPTTVPQRDRHTGREQEARRTHDHDQPELLGQRHTQFWGGCVVMMMICRLLGCGVRSCVLVAKCWGFGCFPWFLGEFS